LVKAIDGNLPGKAFRFGIFRVEISELESRFSPCLDEEIGRLATLSGCLRHSCLLASLEAESGRGYRDFSVFRYLLRRYLGEVKGFSVRKITVSGGFLL
jgi:hypothetical protein